MNTLFNRYPLLIIADDLTGANDTGVELVKKGAQVKVLFSSDHHDHSQASDALVINTDSRALSCIEAKYLVQQALSHHQNNSLIYKKIDSTLRGNIGAEIEAILELNPHAIAIVAAAFPDMQRTTLNGKCYVDGIELIETEFASDPKTPIYSSSIKACINQQTALICSEMSLTQLRASNALEQLTTQIEAGSRIIICDSQCNQDLACIANLLTQLNRPIILVGSAGMINALPLTFTRPAQITREHATHPLLIIAGSMSQITKQQIAYALEQQAEFQLVDLNIEPLLPNYNQFELEHYANQITALLSQHKHVIVRTCLSDNYRYQIDALCQQYQLSRTQLGEHLSHFLGQLVARVNHKNQLNNLFLTGGDIAMAVAKSLGAKGFIIKGEVVQGIPYGELIESELVQCRVFTKAGAFGPENVFIKTLDFI